LAGFAPLEDGAGLLQVGSFRLPLRVALGDSEAVEPARIDDGQVLDAAAARHGEQPVLAGAGPTALGLPAQDWIALGPPFLFGHWHTFLSPAASGAREHQVNAPTAAKVRAISSQVLQDAALAAARVFERVGQDGDFRESSLLVDDPSEAPHVRREPVAAD